jgi:hypothetical protein
MKSAAAWLLSALALTWIAYSLTPEVRRYLKIRSM